MPRDVAGNYTLPAGINPVVSDTLIDVNWANPTLDDIASQLNNVLTRDGLLGPTTTFKIQDGTEALPGLAFNSQSTTGWWRDATKAGFSYQGVSQFQASSSGLLFQKLSTFNLGIQVKGLQAITLTDPAAAIAFFDEAAVQNVGTIQRQGDYSTGFLAVNGTAGEGLYLQNASASIKFKGSSFTPLSTDSVSLGSPTLAWSTGYISDLVNPGVLHKVRNLIFPSYEIFGSGSVNTAARFASGIGGGLALITGNDISGNAFSAIYLVSVYPIGGAPGAPVYTLVSSVGPGILPAISFSNNAGFLRFSVSDANASYTYVMLYGGFGVG